MSSTLPERRYERARSAYMQAARDAVAVVAISCRDFEVMQAVNKTLVDTLDDEMEMEDVVAKLVIEYGRKLPRIVHAKLERLVAAANAAGDALLDTIEDDAK